MSTAEAVGIEDLGIGWTTERCLQMSPVGELGSGLSEGRQLTRCPVSAVCLLHHQQRTHLLRRRWRHARPEVPTFSISSLGPVAQTDEWPRVNDDDDDVMLPLHYCLSISFSQLRTESRPFPTHTASVVVDAFIGHASANRSQARRSDAYTITHGGCRIFDA